MRFLKTYEHFNITNNLSEDTNQVLNPALKQEIEHYVDELIEKNYNKLLKMLGIDVSDREVDFDELKIRAIEFFIEEPERMKKVNISLNSLPIGRLITLSISLDGMNLYKSHLLISPLR